MLNIELGDSIYKLDNENIIYIKKLKGNSIDSFWFLKIQSKYRNREGFPQDWKHKWLEASK